MDDQSAVLLSPLRALEQRRAAILRARKPFLVEPPQDVAPLVLGHRLESDRFIGKPLAIGERIGAVVVEWAQRPQFRRFDTDLLAKMPP